MLHRILSLVFGCAKAHHLYSLEFAERGVTLWTFIRTWEKDHVRAFLQRCHARIVIAWVSCGCWGLFGLPVAVSDVSHVFVGTYGDYLVSGYNRRLVQSPIFDSRLFLWFFLLFLDLWIRSPWRNSLSRDRSGQSIATGWCHVPVFVMALLQESCRCCHFLRLSATSWECGFSLWSTLRRLGEGPTATAEWYNTFSTFTAVAISSFCSSCCFNIEEKRWLLTSWPNGKKQISPVSLDSG